MGYQVLAYLLHLLESVTDLRYAWKLLEYKILDRTEESLLEKGGKGERRLKLRFRVSISSWSISEIRLQSS
jgi:hypothetical protein